MFTLLAIALGFITIFLNTNPLGRFFFFFSFLCFSIAIDGNFLGAWEDMFVHARAINDFEVYLFWFAYAAGYLIFCVINHKNIHLSFCEINNKLEPIDLDRLMYSARFLSAISILVAFFNLIKAGDISVMFVNPREWERSFGSNVFLNYIYFSHLSSLILLSVLVFLKKAKSVDFILIALCLFVSTFHGIKFTILHAFVFLSFSFYILSNNRVPRVVLYMSSVFFALILSFFIFVRGGGVDGLINYITSASVNSIYVINVSGFVDYGNTGTLFPINSELISKLVSRASGELHTSKGVSDDTGFLLNDKYNLQSSITLLSVAGPLTFIVWSSILAFLLKKIPTKLSLFQLAWNIHLLNTILMLFTAWELYKFKLLFNLLLMFFISGFIHHKITFSTSKGAGK